MLSLATIQFPEVRLDEFSKNLAFFKKCCKKSQFEDEKRVFSFKMVYQYAKEAFLFLPEGCFYWWNKGAHLQRRNCLSFSKKGNEISWKNYKRLSSDKRSPMFWGAIQSDGLKLLIKCPNKLNAVGYLEILTIYEEKIHFLDIIFQKDNAPLLKSKIIGIFSKKRSGEYWIGQHTVLIWILLKIYRWFWSNDYENRQFFGRI